MTNDVRKRVHDLDVTLWVGKGGPEAVVDELSAQLDDCDLVKARVLRAARGGTTVEAIADELAAATDAEVVDVRGNTAVFHR
jgi:RNA-binding protein